MQSRRDPAAKPNTIRGSTKKSTSRNANRGIRLLPVRTDRPNPYGVQWAEKIWSAEKGREERKSKSKYFPTERARKKFADKLRLQKRAGNLRTMSRMEFEDWLGFKAATESRPWREIVFGWQAWRLSQSAVQPPTRSVADVARDYLKNLKARADADEIAINTYRQHKHKVGLFASQFTNWHVGDIQTKHVTNWLDNLNLGSNGTFNNHLKIVSLLLASAGLAKNPCDGIRRKRESGTEDDRKLTVPQIAQIFHTANTNPRFRICLRRLALETFAGVRFSSACRLLDTDLNSEDRGIRHRASTIKTRKQIYVSGYPEVLFKWLAVAPNDEGLNYTDEHGKVNRERRYLELKSQLFHVARVPHPRNCLRHSFPTYHLAKRQNPGLTSYLLCHKNQQKLWDNYKGNATQAEGERFEGLTPEAVAEIAREWTRGLEERDSGTSPAAAPPTPDA